MKINIYYDKKADVNSIIHTQVGLFFRYYDKANYYVIKFNMPDREAIELFKKVNGEEHLLGKFIILRFKRRLINK